MRIEARGGCFLEVVVVDVNGGEKSKGETAKILKPELTIASAAEERARSRTRKLAEANKVSNTCPYKGIPL